jgi:hypothetical protein
VQGLQQVGVSASLVALVGGTVGFAVQHPDAALQADFNGRVFWCL